MAGCPKTPSTVVAKFECQSAVDVLSIRTPAVSHCVIDQNIQPAVALGGGINGANISRFNTDIRHRALSAPTGVTDFGASPLPVAQCVDRTTPPRRPLRQTQRRRHQCQNPHRDKRYFALQTCAHDLFPHSNAHCLDKRHAAVDLRGFAR